MLNHGGISRNPTIAPLLLSLWLSGAASASVTLPHPDDTQTTGQDPRLALSEIGDEKIEDDDTVTRDGEVDMIPLPDAKSGDSLETDVTDEETGPPEDVQVLYDLELLPEPVRRMRELIVTAASSGNVENMRPLLGTGPTRTQLSISGYDGDPIDFLREISGDGNGQEILAILLDVLNAGYVHLDPGEPTEIYLWPYFYSVPLDGLDDRQKVELFRIITAGDYEDMQAFGAYIFYRTGIGPEGDWKFFVAGD
jgi:hypothetical protein